MNFITLPTLYLVELLIIFFIIQSSIAQHGNAGNKTSAGVSRHKSEKERKIGHRRVGVGGEITYKKVIKIQQLNNLNFILITTL